MEAAVAMVAERDEEHDDEWLVAVRGAELAERIMDFETDAAEMALDTPDEVFWAAIDIVQGTGNMYTQVMAEVIDEDAFNDRVEALKRIPAAVDPDVAGEFI